MFSCVTISMVPEAQGGPFIFWDDLASSAAQAASLGFSGIEIFAPGPESISPGLLTPILEENKLKLAALGTGAGWVKHRLSLTAPDADVRKKAVEFILAMVASAAPFGAAVIIGSMQGRHEGNREQALDWLRDGLQEIGRVALDQNVKVLYEPLNRYETNLLNRMEDALAFIHSMQCSSVLILADLFHMNIEERSLPAALLALGKHLGHLHFVDSNRRPAGLGHIDFTAVFNALRAIDYKGFISAEALPHPDPERAARQTIAAFNQLLAGKSPSPVL